MPSRPSSAAVPNPQSTIRNPQSADPDNRLFGRANRRRLEAEAIRDTLLAVSGKLDAKMGGPAIRDLHVPRRTLYQMTVRSSVEGFRALFDAANPETSVDKRTVSTVAPQALFVLNHPFALEQTRALAARVLKEGPPDDAGRIRWIYALLYGRAPSGAEERLGLELLGPPSSGGSGASDEQRWAEYCQVLLCANELVYVD